MSRVYNFSAGPSMLPESVLSRAAEEMLDCNGTGQSVLEMSHRSKAFEPIIYGAMEKFRKVMNIPDNYKIIFCQGGASTQFSAIPLNFMNGSNKADYVLSGQFSTKAYKEACKYGDVKAVASSKEQNFSCIPELDKSEFRPDADYFYICQNNTIYGTRFATLPDTGNVPLVADVSSCFLSEPMDVSKYGVIYGGAQKNVAPAGLTVVIVREDLLGHERDITPVMLNLKTLADNDSMYNTPPCYPIYICGLVLDWIESIGGLEAMKARNEKKAGILYDFIDSSNMFNNPVKKSDRSMMNVTFVTESDELNAKFVKEAADAGFVNLKGHRSVGGMRASIYNAMPIEGVEKLVDFMGKFEKNN
ncbi:MAG: 3-phosphoserine/phosphohydroxythreonine transaminase [Clostridia bacterium]|nr:3-phosphoserine/phosphohydroxythreonine transaminase [Clostridia bacterium]MBQ6467092.1 3-phosphoserine/phosphohydroxythreonine transaminase [Clostridia bacterium]MBR5773029.1 3-phosphoserine/phosphohydroxythreonine transaminase [Clostridia bacterium]MBR6335855.1 3-phosphoserine/phosphohydroxythreonine transaminase [Clostridia bacterium]